MNSEAKQTLTFREVLKLISTIISWTVFALLVICACFLLYYFIATKVYTISGGKYEPKFSLYTIISPSMVPTINVLDMIVTMRVNSPEDLKKGDKLQGTVRNVVDFGLFIDIGLKNDGLAHISKLTNEYIKNPSDLFSVGDIVDCYVDSIDLDKKKVSLSLLKNSI